MVVGVLPIEKFLRDLPDRFPFHVSDRRRSNANDDQEFLRKKIARRAIIAANDR
jgi:hypothetical protein